MSVTITKTCPKCSKEQPNSCFYKDLSKSDGLSSYCKPCRRQRSSEYSLENTKKVQETRKQHYLKNKERVNKRNRAYHKTNYVALEAKKKIWLENNKEQYLSYRRRYKKERKGKNLTYKLAENLRNRLYYALKVKSWKKSTHFSVYIGCEQDFLKQHLEKQFQPGMSWENYGQWHIDHIKPLGIAKTENEIYELCHYTNLQPLWAVENIRKSNKCP